MIPFTVFHEWQTWDVLPLMRLQIKRKNCIQKTVKTQSFNFPVVRQKPNIGKDLCSDAFGDEYYSTAE